MRHELRGSYSYLLTCLLAYLLTCLLAYLLTNLEAVDGAHTRAARQHRLEQAHLRVVRRHHQHVVEL